MCVRLEEWFHFSHVTFKLCCYSSTLYSALDYGDQILVVDSSTSSKPSSDSNKNLTAFTREDLNIRTRAKPAAFLFVIPDVQLLRELTLYLLLSTRIYKLLSVIISWVRIQWKWEYKESFYFILCNLIYLPSWEFLINK